MLYLLFNEGYHAHAGDDLIRQDLCGEALRLGRLVAQAPHLATAPAAHALVALMAFQTARLPARVDCRGEMILLDVQDRSLWDRGLVALGFAHFGGHYGYSSVQCTRVFVRLRSAPFLRVEPVVFVPSANTSRNAKGSNHSGMGRTDE